MSIKKADSVGWIVGIFFIILIGALYLFYRIEVSIAIALILLPIISYLAVKNKISFISFSASLFIPFFCLLISFFAAIAMFDTHRKQQAFYARNLIDGRMVSKEVLVEPNDGAEYWENREAYVPYTKKGENAMKVIKWALTLLAISSVLWSWRSFVESVEKDKAKRKDSRFRARNMNEY